MNLFVTRPLRDAALAHTNAQRTEELTERWLQDLANQNSYEQIWVSLLPEQTIDNYNIIPITKQHQLWQQNCIHNDSSFYYDHPNGFNGTQRFFQVAHSQHDDQPTSFVSIKRHDNHWHIQQTIPAQPDIQAAITRIADEITSRYQAAYDNVYTHMPTTGYWSPARAMPPEIRATLPEAILSTPGNTPYDVLPF